MTDGGGILRAWGQVMSAGERRAPPSGAMGVHADKPPPAAPAQPYALCDLTKSVNLSYIVECTI
jgi:hypothetical protein